LFELPKDRAELNLGPARPYFKLGRTDLGLTDLWAAARRHFMFLRPTVFLGAFAFLLTGIGQSIPDSLLAADPATTSSDSRTRSRKTCHRIAGSESSSQLMTESLAMCSVLG
jgi:hypothetical protein